MKMKFFEKTGPGARRTALILILAVLLTVGCFTTAFALRDTTGEVTESLEKADVSCEVNENWSVTNTGNIPALIRVRVIVNLTDDDTLLPGDVPDYTVGSGWVKIGDYLYYTGIVDFEEGENGTGNVTTPAISFRGSIGFAEALVLLCLKYISLIVKYHLQTPWNEAEDLAETARKGRRRRSSNPSFRSRCRVPSA